MTDPALARLAQAAAILIDWEDAQGRPQTVSDDALRAVLAGLGLSCQSGAQCRDSIARLGEQTQAALLTADCGQPFHVPGASGRAQLVLEGGGARDLVLDEGRVPPVPEPGYHRLEANGREWTIAVAPPRGARVAARSWGIAVQLYSLRGEAGEGFGHFGLLSDFARAAAKRGADAVAISPVHALFSADPDRYSPYGPSSRMALNPIYADPRGASGEGGQDLIDWRTAWPARIARLRARFATMSPGEADAFEAFAAAADLPLRRHALFEALHGHFFRLKSARGWQDWPVEFRDPSSDAVTRFAAEQADELRFHLFCQWQAGLGLADAQAAARGGGMAIGLITDIAVGVDPGGSEGWAAPDDLLMGLGIGAPPDAYSTTGQNWGITTFSPMALRCTGFRPFIDLLRAAMRDAGGVRIDHALGLRRLWVVPHGASPLEGAYLRCPEADLLRLIALESARHGAIAIGEDLGVVPPGLREALAGRGILGMRVLPFERTEDGGFTPSDTWDQQAVAMTSTHDMTPIAGWWRGRDLAWHEKLGAPAAGAEEKRNGERTALWDACTAAGTATGAEPGPDEPAAALDAAIAFTARSASTLAIIPAEDLFGLEEAPNLPGTIDEHPNWRRRLPGTVEALFGRPDVTARIGLIEAGRRS